MVIIYWLLFKEVCAKQLGRKSNEKISIIAGDGNALSVMPITVFASESVELEVDVNVDSVTADSTDEITYTVSLPEDANINGITLSILYDKEKLEWKSETTTGGTINSQTGIFTTSSGTSISTGTLFTVTFVPVSGAAGDAQISLDVTTCTTGIDITDVICTAPSKTITITKSATAIAIEGSTATVERDKTIQLTAKLDPENSTDTVEWSSKNEDIATVDENGLVTGVKEGEAIITAKVKDNDNLSATCTVTVTNPAISGTLTITGASGQNGAPQFGDKLTASLSGYENDEKVIYTWYREGSETKIGDAATYTIDAEDIGKTLTVKATHPDFVGTLEKSTGTVQKAQKAEKPDAPTAASKDYTSITLATVEGCEYKLGADGSWQASPIFDGLTAGTEYTFYIRYKETTTHLTSEPASATIATKAYGAKDIAFTIKLDGVEATDYDAYVAITGDKALTGTQEGTVTIAPKAGYYLNDITVSGATNTADEPIFPVDTSTLVQYKLTLKNVDQPATIAIDVKTKETQEITFKNDGVEVSGDTLTKVYDGLAFSLTAESTKGETTDYLL